MKVGDQVRNVHSGRIAAIKKIEITVVEGKKVPVYTIPNFRFDRYDLLSQEELDKHWVPYSVDKDKEQENG